MKTFLILLALSVLLPRMGTAIVPALLAVILLLVGIVIGLLLRPAPKRHTTRRRPAQARRTPARTR